MAKSNAQRQREYRERINSSKESRECLLAKERIRWKNRSEKRKIEKQSATQKKRQRKKWKVAQQKCRSKKESKIVNKQPQENANKVFLGMEEEMENEISQDNMREEINGSSDQNLEISNIEQSSSTEQIKTKERKKRRKKIYANDVKIKKLQREVKRLKRKTGSQRVKLSRALKKQNLSHNNGESPNSKTRRTLQNEEETRKTLMFHHALVSDISGAMQSIKHDSERRIVKDALIGGEITRSKTKRLSEETFHFRERESNDQDRESSTEKKKQAVQDFLYRDDNSRITTGKKQTLTKNKDKRQKRLLSDTLMNLHCKFTAENTNPDVNMSYSLFCHLRPFNVVQPNAEDRETCLCKAHENLQFMADVLHKRGIIDTSDIVTLAKSICCQKTEDDRMKKECMYGECQECNNNEATTMVNDELTKIDFFQWVQTERTVKKVTGTTESETYKCTAKESLSTTVGELVTMFQDSLNKFRRHHFNITWQYRISREMKLELNETTCILHIDFSENYTCKHAAEIQSVHFGASHQQATLHTGVLYLFQKEPVGFCTISACNYHGPAGIWGHLDPVLDKIRLNHPQVINIIFWSDSPATQYRQKGNFFLLSKVPYEKGFKAVGWNFFEAGHGKGAPDGIGGVLKRLADQLVAQGNDIPSPEELYKILKPVTSVDLMYVEEETIKEYVTVLPATLVPVPKTMRIHQVTSCKPGQITHSDVSCLCQLTTDTGCDLCTNRPTHVFPCHGDSTAVQSDTDESAMPDAVTLRPVTPECTTALGKYCLVRYEGRAYPGIIMDLDETDAKVNCMHRVGENRFFFPSTCNVRPDICWYSYENILTLIPEPTPITSRHSRVDTDIWNAVQPLLDQ